MWNDASVSFPAIPGWRLLIALVVSLLIHWGLAGATKFRLPELWQALGPLIVELAPPPPPPPVRPVPLRQPVAKSAPRRPPPLPVAPALPEPAPRTDEPHEPVSLGVTEPVSEVPLPQVAVPELPPVASVIHEEPEVEVPAIAPPLRVEIDFQVVRKGSVAASERQRYQVDEAGHYQLSSLIEPRGLLALALSDLVQESTGRVTAHGLAPERYRYQYGKNKDKAQTARFDRDAGKLVMEQGSRRQEVELREGAQDLMSFMYQFMFVPPLQDMRIGVTNGKKFREYHYVFGGEHMLETRFGVMRTWHISKSGQDGEEKTELWLAVDYHFLPIKISQTEKDGTVTERMAVRLHTE